MHTSPPLTRQCVGVTYISPMSGHYVRRWATFKRHWGGVYYVYPLNGYWPAPATLAQHWTDIWSVSACTLWPHPPPTESTVQCWRVDGKSRQRWTSVEPALGWRVVFAGHSVVGHLVADTGPLSYLANTVFDAGPTLKQHWVNYLCLLGISYQPLNCGIGDIVVAYMLLIISIHYTDMR